MQKIPALLIGLGSLSLGISSSLMADINDAEMVDVPGGFFQMGCTLSDADPTCQYTPEEKRHLVNLSPFKIDKYEVTFRRYQKCVDKGDCTPPAIGGALNYGWPDIDKFPVNGVTWIQADQFCKSEGRRLPTEAEWELAARGNDGRIFPWGNEKPSCDLAVMDKADAGFLGCGTGNTMDVGSRPKGQSPYGAMDMAGNLWEWTADWYSKTYYENSPIKDPQGPATGLYKTARGGDFFTRGGYELRSTGRFEYEPTDYSIAVGFRCAKSL
ncbi:formylglycine-generating enzyme family protein [Endozoicomonadaceae bacterium StTr2]